VRKDPVWLEGHDVHTVPVGDGWRARCECHWGSARKKRERQAVRSARWHVARADVAGRKGLRK
jgi:hypothetical protein